MRKLTFALAVWLLSSTLGCDGPASTDAGPTDTGQVLYDCDPKGVTCEVVEPECPPGYVPAKSGFCWDACVPNAMCERPIPCESMGLTRCPTGWGCAAGECAPPR